MNQVFVDTINNLIDEDNSNKCDLTLKLLILGSGTKELMNMINVYNASKGDNDGSFISSSSETINSTIDLSYISLNFVIKGKVVQLNIYTLSGGIKNAGEDIVKNILRTCNIVIIYFDNNSSSAKNLIKYYKFAKRNSESFARFIFMEFKSNSANVNSPIMEEVKRQINENLNHEILSSMDPDSVYKQFEQIAQDGFNEFYIGTGSEIVRAGDRTFNNFSNYDIFTEDELSHIEKDKMKQEYKKDIKRVNKKKNNCCCFYCPCIIY